MIRSQACPTKRLPLFFLFLVLLVAVWPLFKPGFIPTHDGEYHLIRFWQFAKNIKSGIFFPRWAPDLDRGFGVPLFSFFYPFPNYPGGIFHLFGFSLADSFKLSLMITFIFSGIFFYLWGQRVLGPWPALAGSLFYLFAPYHFLDLYVRGSIGELWALVWLPAILWGLEKRSLVSTSLFFGLLILSHNILALVFTPFLIGYAFVIGKRRLWPALVLGLGLSAYFWLPALAERKWVAGLELVNFADHFPALSQLILPSWGTGFSVPGILDGMSFQIGLGHLLVVCLAFFLTRRHPSKRAVFFLGCFFLLVFLSLEISLPVWKLIPLMKYGQYPWRLNSLIIVTASFLAGWVVTKLRRKRAILFLIVLVLGLNWRYSRPVIYQPRSDFLYLDNPVWAQGTATLADSFKTAWAKEHSPPREKLGVLEGEVVVGEAMIRPTSYLFQTKAATKTKLRVNTNYFPGWRVRVNGEETKISLEKDGAFSFHLPEGSQQVKVEFGETRFRLLADTVSMISFLILALKVVK